MPDSANAVPATKGNLIFTSSSPWVNEFLNSFLIVRVMSMVSNGAMQTMNDTLQAWVYLKAVFSVRKYREPPLIPIRTNKNS